MGKRSKQGASLRATKRANVANQQLEQALAVRSEETRVRSKDDAELFVLDTARRDGGPGGGKRRRRRAEVGEEDDEKRKKLKSEHSEREERQIRRLIRVHGEGGVIALAEEGRTRSSKRGKLTSTGVLASMRPGFDLWGEAVPPTTKMTTARALASASGANKKERCAAAPPAAAPRLAVEVAHPGQSYRPDGEHHQDAIGAALSIEIRRNEAVEYKERPMSDGMSAFARGFLVGDTDDDTEEDDDDDEDNAGEGGDGKASTGKRTLVKKRKEKLTRAQRNKQRRVKAELLEIRERKSRKAFIHQANEVRSHDKAVRRAEMEAADRRAEVERLRAERRSRPLGSDVWGGLSRRDPITAPSLPVALTEELGADGGGGGSLRTVVPKGSLVTDRVESMAARNMIVKRRASGARRIVQGKKRNNRTRGGGDTEYMLM